MPNTYTQLYIHIVFAVQGRQNLIQSHDRETLHKYITAVIQNDGHKMIAVYCMPDHAHILVGLNPSIAISQMVLDIKRSTTNFINSHHLHSDHFNWQKGYGAFTYNKSNLDQVTRYILNQQEHHKVQTFQQEFKNFLEKFEVEYDNKYLFEFID